MASQTLLESKLNQSERTLADVLSQLSRSQREVESLKKELVEAKQTLTTTNTERSEVLIKFESVQTENQNLKNDIRQLRISNEQLSSNLRDSLKKTEDMVSQLFDKEQKLRENDANLRIKEKELLTLRNIQATLDLYRSSWESEKQVLKNHVNFLEEKLEERAKELIASRDDNLRTIQKLNEEHSCLAGDHQRATETVDQLKETVSSLEKENSEVYAKLIEQERVSNGAVLTVKREMEELNQNLMSERNQVRAYETKIRSLSKKLADKEGEFTTKKEDVESLKKVVESQKVKIEELNEVSQLAKLVQGIENVNVRDRQKIFDLVTEITDPEPEQKGAGRGDFDEYDEDDDEAHDGAEPSYEKITDHYRETAGGMAELLNAVFETLEGKREDSKTAHDLVGVDLKFDTEGIPIVEESKMEDLVEKHIELMKYYKNLSSKYQEIEKKLEKITSEAKKKFPMFKQQQDKFFDIVKVKKQLEENIGTSVKTITTLNNDLTKLKKELRNEQDENLKYVNESQILASQVKRLLYENRDLKKQGAEQGAEPQFSRPVARSPFEGGVASSGAFRNSSQFMDDSSIERSRPSFSQSPTEEDLLSIMKEGDKSEDSLTFANVDELQELNLQLIRKVEDLKKSQEAKIQQVEDSNKETIDDLQQDLNKKTEQFEGLKQKVKEALVYSQFDKKFRSQLYESLEMIESDHKMEIHERNLEFGETGTQPLLRNFFQELGEIVDLKEISEKKALEVALNNLTEKSKQNEEKTRESQIENQLLKSQISRLQADLSQSQNRAANFEAEKKLKDSTVLQSELKVKELEGKLAMVNAAEESLKRRLQVAEESQGRISREKEESYTKLLQSVQAENTQFKEMLMKEIENSRGEGYRNGSTSNGSNHRTGGSVGSGASSIPSAENDLLQKSIDREREFFTLNLENKNTIISNLKNRLAAIIRVNRNLEDKVRNLVQNQKHLINPEYLDSNSQSFLEIDTQLSSSKEKINLLKTTLIKQQEEFKRTSLEREHLIAEMKKSFMKLNSHNQSNEAKITNLNEEILRLNENIMMQYEENFQYKNMFHCNRAVLKTYSDRLKDVEVKENAHREANLLQSRVKELENKLDILTVEKSTLEAKHTLEGKSWEDQKVILNRQIQELQDSQEAVRAENGHLREQINISKLIQEAEQTAGSVLSDQEAAAQSQEKLLSLLNQKIRAFEASSEQSKLSLLSYKAKYEEIHKELLELKLVKEKLEIELKQLRAPAILKKKLASLEKDHESLLSEKKGLESKLSLHNNTINELRTQLADTKDKLNTAVYKYQLRVNKLQLQGEAHSAEISKLSTPVGAETTSTAPEGEENVGLLENLNKTLSILDKATKVLMIKSSSETLLKSLLTRKEPLGQDDLERLMALDADMFESSASEAASRGQSKSPEREEASSTISQGSNGGRKRVLTEVEPLNVAGEDDEEEGEEDNLERPKKIQKTGD